MATNIGPKIGIDGEKEYRQQINLIIQQSKTLAAEMKAVTSAFTKDTSAKEKSKKVGEVLTQQIATQRKRVEELAKMTEESAKATGENSKETLSWKEALNNATAQLNKMEKGLNADGTATKEFTDQMSGATKESGTFKDTLKALLVDKALHKGLEALKNGAKALANAMKDAAKAATEAYKESAQWADDLKTLSVQTGISTQKLQEYEYMADLVDTDVSIITDSMRKLTKNMATARKGTGDAADAFKALGINIKNDVTGELRNNEDVFNEVITALGRMTNETQRDAYAMQIFGKSAQELNPLIAAGGDALAGFAQEARAMGYVLDEDAISALNESKDAMARLENAGEAAKRQLSAAFAPFVNSIAAEVIPSISETVGQLGLLLSGNMTLSEFMDNLGAKLSSFFASLTSKLKDLLPEIGATISGILSKINELLPQIAEMAAPLVSMIAVTILENLPEIFDTGLVVIETLLKGLGSALPELIPAAIECIMTLVTTLIDHIPLLLESAGELVEGLVSGILKALPKLIASAPKIISSIITGLIRGLPQILMQGGEILITLITGLIQAIPDLIMALPQIIMAIIDTFRNTDWGAVGSGILQGIKDGFLKKVSSLWDAVKEACQRVLNSVKNFLGIHSPSKVFADQVGEMIPAGIAVGIEDNTKDMLSAARSSMELLTGAAASGAGYTTNYGGVSINVYASEGQNVNALADIIMSKMQSAVRRREAVFA